MTDFAGLLGTLADGGVECILVGGVAATVHGSARLTRDVDVVSRIPCASSIATCSASTCRR